MIVFYAGKKIREFLFDKRIQLVLAVTFLLAFAFTGWNSLKTYSDGMSMILRISIQTQESGQAILYYDDGKGFNETNKSLSFIPGDSRLHELRFKIPFLTTISGLRFDPPSLKQGDGIINRVELSDHRDWVLYRFSLDHLKPIHEIKSFSQEQNEIRFSIENSAKDPQILICMDEPLQMPRWRIIWAKSAPILFEGTITFFLCSVLFFIWFQWRDKTIATLIVVALIAAIYVFCKELSITNVGFSAVSLREFPGRALVKTILTWWIGIGLLLTVSIKASSVRVSFDRVSYGIILILIGVYILLSNPFLKIPHDVWEHLLRILSIHDEGRSFVFFPEELGYLQNIRRWHWLWAIIFRFAGVDNLFIWAKTIHVVQFILAVYLMLYASNILMNHLVPNLKERHGNWLSLLAVLIWLVGNGTYSETHSQSWIIWYLETTVEISKALDLNIIIELKFFGIIFLNI